MATNDRKCRNEFTLKHGYFCELPKGHSGQHEARCPNAQFHQCWPNEREGAVAIDLAERVSVLERALREVMATEYTVSRGQCNSDDWRRRLWAVAMAEGVLGKPQKFHRPDGPDCPVCGGQILDLEVLLQTADYLHQKGGGPLEDRLRLLYEHLQALISMDSNQPEV